MPGKDWSRWQENEDGSYSRRLGAYTEVGVNATAAAVEAAEAAGLDLAYVEGTGKDGKITKGDVDAALGGE